MIALQEPHTGSLKLVASSGAKEVLQPKVFEWYGVPPDIAALQREVEGLRTQLASLGGDTGWPEG